MKKIGVFALAALALLVSLMLYSYFILSEYEEYQKSLADDYVAAVESLQEIDAELPGKSGGKFKIARYDDWMAVRTAAGDLLAEQFKDPDRVSTLTMRRTRILMLQRVAEELDSHALGLSEYCALSERWKSIVALPEFGEMQKQWRKRVRVQSDPKALPLPAPARDVRPEELAWVRQHAQKLTDTMRVDVFDVLLGKIAADDLPEE